MRRLSAHGLATLLLAVALAGCSPGTATVSGPVTTVGGLTVERVVSGLDGPTQMIFGPDGRLWVAQLAGDENAGRGEIVAVDLDDGDREVLLDGLIKPTGLAWLDDSLWIATPTAVLRADGQPLAAPRPVVHGLPNNGRSNGTLTPTPDGSLLYETSGRERDGGAVDGSGALWVLDPAEPARRRRIASGLKNAYAHVYDAAGQLWTTEVAEPIGGVAAPDEVNRVDAGGDYGWPACVGRRVPVEAFGGDAVRCRATEPPRVTFEPVGATPTSIVVSPFRNDHFVVALWNADRVVSAPISGGGAVEDLLAGIERPQHLLVDGDGLLVSEHGTGTIWRVRADG